MPPRARNPLGNSSRALQTRLLCSALIGRQKRCYETVHIHIQIHISIHIMIQFFKSIRTKTEIKLLDNNWNEREGDCQVARITLAVECLHETIREAGTMSAQVWKYKYRAQYSTRQIFRKLKHLIYLCCARKYSPRKCNERNKNLEDAHEDNAK